LPPTDVPSIFPTLVGTPPDKPNPLHQLWRESIGELPASLDPKQRELLGQLVQSFNWGDRERQATFAGLVVQQLDHLLARVAEQDQLLLKLTHQIQRYEARHVQEKHPAAATERNSVQGVWADGVARQHQQPGLE